MKKASFILTWLLFVLTMLYPAGTLIADCFGYTFKLISVSAFAVAIAALSICSAIVYKSTPENKVTQILWAVIMPLSILNAMFYILACPQVLVIASVLISSGCCCFLTVQHGRPLTLKVVALLLSALMVLPIGFLSSIALIFGNLGQNTVVQTVASPNGKYYAQIIESDQGALGGDTFVDVYEKSEKNAILFKTEKKPQRVYFGDWGAYKNMQIYWKDDNYLVINSVEYEIK